MLRVGIIGIGFMGMVHYLTYQRVRGTKVTAISDRSDKKLNGDWTGIQGNFGPPGSHVDLDGINTYDSIGELLQDENIDLIDICLPPKLHAPIAIKALKAGKAVFCEKPIALTCKEADRMIKVAEAKKLPLLIGHVLPYFPEYAWALKEIHSGKHGKLLGGSFKRVISDPAWLSNYWSATEVGGPLFDLHVHDAHFVRTLFGMPNQVKSTGRMRNDLPEYWHSFFEYDKEKKQPNYTVEVTCGITNQPSRPFQHAFEIHCEKSTLMFDFAVIGDKASYLTPPTILPNRGKVRQPSLGDGDPMEAFHQELKAVTKAIRTGKPTGILEAAIARDAIYLCEKQKQSLNRGKAVKV